jgi:hypothetical protein
MQAELKQNITSLQSKIEKLIFLHQKVLEDNLKLQALVESFQLQIAEQNNIMEVLVKEKNDLLGSNHQVVNHKQASSDWRNEQIDEMMRDIDKCIALLSMNKKSE